MSAPVLPALCHLRDRLRELESDVNTLIDAYAATGEELPRDEGAVIELREGGGCQCTGDPLPNVQNTAGAGMSGSTYSCVGCGQEVTDVSKRKVVGG